MPKLATVAGRRLQVDAALRSHERRFGPAAGFWLPECAYVAGLEQVLAERGIAYTCLDQSAVEADGGYPGAPEYLEYHRLSPNGTRLWSISGEPYDPAAALARAEADAAAFLGSVRERLEAHRDRTGDRGLLTFAIDTELLGHWWAEGPLWLGAVVRGAKKAGVRLLTLPEATAEHEPEAREAREASWGQGKSLETWDSPGVSDLAWAARRLELRLVRAIESAGPSPALERAARELLAVQSSDWAFMDHRGQAGDYPYTRVTAHAEAMLEAIESPKALDPRLRNLAPDLSLAPLLEP
jgi:1,4-alpha-glucan branching enzyme